MEITSLISCYIFNVSWRFAGVHLLNDGVFGTEDFNQQIHFPQQSNLFKSLIDHKSQNETQTTGVTVRLYV